MADHQDSSSSDDENIIKKPNTTKYGGGDTEPIPSTSAMPPEMLQHSQMIQHAMTLMFDYMRKQGHDPTRVSTENSPTPPVATTTKVESRFRLPKFDPDDSEHTMVEWFDDVTKLKDKLQIDEDWMIIQCADSMKGRALKFYNHWRPIEKNWQNFVTDFTNAFPDGETPGSRIARAVALTSNKFHNLTDYALTKIRYLKRFMDSMPWESILSCVEHGLKDKEARSLIRLHRPNDQVTLLQLLGQFQAQNATCRDAESDSSRRRSSRSAERIQGRRYRSRSHHSKQREPISAFKKFSGVCFKCGQKGHRQFTCQAKTKNDNKERTSDTGVTETRSTSTSNCDYCLKPGHREVDCYSKKNGRPRSVRMIRQYRSVAQTPLATVICENKATPFTYLVDTGADVSILHENVTIILGVTIQPLRKQIQGAGSNIDTIGTCVLYIFMKQITAEIMFWVVPDHTIPGEGIDALIGMDVVRRPGLQLTMVDGYAELKYQDAFVPKVAAITNDEISKKMSGLDERQNEQLVQLLKKHRSTVKPFVTTGKMNVSLLNSEPVAYHPRRLAYAERIRVQNKINELLREGIIRESQSSYASPIVLVTKKNGELRLCVDYRDVNKRVVKDRYPLPRIQDQIDALSGAIYFTVLDMRAGFHQIEIEENSKHVTAFITPDGHYEYNRMPFGYVNAPSIYQRAIDKALGTFKGTIAFVYLDDILIPSLTIDEGLINLEKVLVALAHAGFSLNYQKCKFFLKETEYLGLIVGNGCVKPSTSKINALANTNSPKDVRGVRQFMGLAGYFRRFIQNFSIKTAPITALLKKDSVFKWTDEHENIRQNIIKLLSTQPVLSIFNRDLATELHTDASSVGIAAILMQRKDNLIKPIAYFSRKTNDCESRYHSYDLETLAIVDAVEYFRVYLYGIYFTIYTDCNSVRATALKKHMHPRVARWWIKLQDYDFTIEYRSGTKMGHVDYLSRNPVASVCVIKNRSKSDKTLAEWQADDEFCLKVKDRALQPSELCQYIIKNNLVYKRGDKNRNSLCYVPTEARLKTMALYHDQASHVGWRKGLLKMQESLFWPRMSKCFRKYVERCQKCLLNKSHTGKRTGLFQLGEKPNSPFDVWHIDHAGPLVKSRGYTYILVILDAFSKYCRFVPIANKTAKASVKALQTVFAETGIPKRIVADRATAFASSIFSEMLNKHNVELHLIATGVPRGNGQVERVMRNLFNLMRSTLTNENEKHWANEVKKIENDVNNLIHSTTGKTPNLLMFGETNRLASTEHFLKDVPLPVSENKDSAVETARTKIKKSQTQSLVRLNIKRRATPPLVVGTKVAVEDTQAPSRGKLGVRFKGPYKIVEIFPNDRYRLHRSGARTTVAARDQLRVWPKK